MVSLLLAVPIVAGLLAMAIPWHVPRRVLLLATAMAHAGLATACVAQMPRTVLNGWIAIDAIAAVFLLITSFVFLVVSFYTVGYLARESRGIPHAPDDEPPFANSPEAIFTGCYLLFLGAMTWVLVSQHWGLMWIAVEATTLASAPLIHFHRNPRSLEATWKYLVICSVGIALALLGNFFLAVAVRSIPGGPAPLTIGHLELHARQLDPLWLKAAFLLLLVGYGTKMGLAPMHTWLPDAHSEAPSVVSALLSGVLLNCAFLAVLRGHSLLVKAGLGDFSRELLVLFGLLSMVVAALFIINQLDYKRLLAYSSVEHMGILALGVGIGGMAGFGSLLHAVNHSVAKSMLFLAAGNTLAWCHSRSTRQAPGILRCQAYDGHLVDRGVAGHHRLTTVWDVPQRTGRVARDPGHGPPAGGGAVPRGVVGGLRGHVGGDLAHGLWRSGSSREVGRCGSRRGTWFRRGGGTGTRRNRCGRFCRPWFWLSRR